jgi:hypothetical protein
VTRIWQPEIVRDRYVECETVHRIRSGAAALERLQARNTRLKAREGPPQSKGERERAISLHGADRWPEALYKDSWLRILAGAAEIEALLREKEFKLKTKEIKETGGIPRSRASAFPAGYKLLQNCSLPKLQLMTYSFHH